MPEQTKPQREIRDYLDAQLAVIHDLQQEGIKANGIYIRESPVPVSAITREFVLGRLCGPRMTDSAGHLQHGMRPSAVPVGKEAAITEGAKPSGGGRALLVDIEATHEGLTKNYTYYPAANMEASAKTWLEPYQKPVITHHRNHDMFVPAEDPIGRVVSQKFADSGLRPGAKTILLQHRITDPEAQQKIVDGRYQTTSIGAVASSLHCSVCGTNLLEDWCDHRRGRKYSYKKDENSPEEQKLAYWIVGPMWYEEDSYVNTPADEAAQVVGWRWEEEGKQSAGGRSESVEMSSEQNLLTQMDELLDPPVATGDQAPTVAEGSALPAAEGQGGPDAASAAREGATAGEDPLAQIEAENAGLKEKLMLAETDATAARKEAEEATAARIKAEQELLLANAENKQLTEKAVGYAKLARKQMVEHVLDLKIAVGEAKEEDRTALAQSLVGLRPKELQEMAKETRTKRPVRQPASVTSPGQIGEGEVSEAADASSAAAEPTLKDLEEAFHTAVRY